MDSILKKGVLLVSLTGIMTAFPMAVHAADIDTGRLLHIR